MSSLKVAAAAFTVAFGVCLLIQLSCSALMAQEVREYRFTEVPCPPCEVEMTCESTEVLAKLDRLIEREACPDCVCEETAESVTDETVKEEGWRGTDPIGDVRVDGSAMALDVPAVASGTWSSQHPKAAKWLKRAAWVVGAYIGDRIAHHNDYLWYHGHDDDPEVRKVTVIHEGDVTIICKGRSCN